MIIVVDTRQKLINKGAHLFAEKGFSDVSLDDIVTRADISKGAFYHHFPSKEVFYEEILKYAYDVFTGMYEKRAACSKSNEQQTDLFVDSVFEFCFLHRMFFFIVLREITRIDLGEKSPMSIYKQKINEHVQTLIGGKDKGFAAHLVLGMIQSALTYRPETPEDVQVLLKKVKKYIHACIGVR